MFTCFPRLPYEIQDMIWSRALPPARNMQIKEHTNWESQRSSSQASRSSPGQNYSTDVVPVVLHVCTQSRALAMLTYQLASYSPSVDRALWMNFDKDTLVIVYLRGHSSSLTFGPSRLKGTVSMVDHLKYLAIATDASSNSIRHIRDFKKLNEIVLYEKIGRQALAGYRVVYRINQDDLTGPNNPLAPWASIRQSLEQVSLRSRNLLLQQLTDNAKNLKILDYELPEVKYLPQAEFDERFEVPESFMPFF